MRQELEFGGVTARGGGLSRCASTAVSHSSFSSSVSSTAYISAAKIGAFLIDTLPIRNTSKSFDCSIGVHSNRHPSATPNSRQKAPDAANLAPRGNLHIPSGAEQNSTPREMLRVEATLSMTAVGGARRAQVHQQETSRSLTGIRKMRGWIRDESAKMGAQAANLK